MRLSMLSPRVEGGRADPGEFDILRNGPDKNDSNNGNEHVGMQKGANFSIVCTYF